MVVFLDWDKLWVSKLLCVCCLCIILGGAMGVSSCDRAMRILTRENTRLQQEVCVAKHDRDRALAERDSAVKELAARDAQLVAFQRPSVPSLRVMLVPAPRPYELREALPEVGDSLERSLGAIDSSFAADASEGLGLCEGATGGLVFEQEDIKPVVSVASGSESVVVNEVIDLTNEDSDEEASEDAPEVEPEDIDAALTLALSNHENPEGDSEPEAEPEAEAEVEPEAEADAEVEPEAEAEETDHILSWGQRLSLATLEDPDEDSDVEPEESCEPETGEDLDEETVAVEPEPGEVEDSDSDDPEPGEVEDSDSEPSESADPEPGEGVRVRITRNKRRREDGYKTDPTWTKSAESQARKRYSLGIANKNDYFMVY